MRLVWHQQLDLKNLGMEQFAPGEDFPKINPTYTPQGLQKLLVPQLHHSLYSMTILYPHCTYHKGRIVVIHASMVKLGYTLIY